MARVANLENNARVKNVVSVTGDKYKRYTVDLNDTFYVKVSYGDRIHSHESTKNRIDLLNAKIVRLENCKSADYLRTSIEIGASTLTEVHEAINNLQTLDQWNQYRLGMIDGIKEELAKVEEKIKEEDREHRGNATYTQMLEPWKNVIVQPHMKNPFRGFIDDDTAIMGAVGHTVKEVAESNVNVAEWKEKELVRLYNVLGKLNKSIETLQRIDEQEAQEWINDLKKEAIDYIENGKTEN